MSIDHSSEFRAALVISQETELADLILDSLTLKIPDIKKHIKTNFDDAIHFLESEYKNNLRSVLIISETDPKLGSFKKFIEWHQNHPSKLICISAYANQKKSEFPNAIWIQKPDIVDSILKALGFVDTKESNTHDQWIRLSLGTLFQIGKAPCELYLKLNETKKVKLVRSGQKIEPEDILHWKEQGISELFAPFHAISTQIQSLIRDLENFSFAKETLTSEITERVQFAFRSVAGVLKQLPTSEKENQFLEQITALATSYATKQMLSIDCDSIDPQSAIFAQIPFTALLLHWGYCAGITDKNDLFSLAMASLLHDLTLERPEMSSYPNEESLLAAEKFSLEEIKNYLEHPEIISKKIQNLKRFSDETRIIIEQHHELPNGIGFPKGIKAKDFHPLSALFVLARELHQSKLSMIDFLSRISAEYRVEPFLQWIEYVEKKLSKKLSKK